MVRLLKLYRLLGRDLRLLWFALRHPARPVWLLPLAGLLGLYAFEPANFAIPVLGAVDDLVLVPLALHVLLMLLPSRIRAEHERRGGSLFGMRRF